jgi:hypothetical protein
MVNIARWRGTLIKGLKIYMIHIQAGTFESLNFGKLNGQIDRRCLPVHFPGYQLQRPEECLEFQTTLFTLLRKVPLLCEAETFVSS